MHAEKVCIKVCLAKVMVKSILGYPIKWLSSCQMGGTRWAEAAKFWTPEGAVLSLAPRSEEFERAGF